MNALQMTPDRLGLLDGDVPYTWRGTLDWLAYDVLLNQGPVAYKALVRDRQSCGANVICFSLRLAWGRNLHAANPAFWTNLIPAARIAADCDMRICPIVFCDTATDLGDGLTNPASWQPHLDRVMTDLGAEVNMSFVYANQPNHPSQHPALYDACRSFTKPKDFTSLLAIRDNPRQSENPILPLADGAAYCCERDEARFMEIGASMGYIVNGWPHDETKWQGAHTWSVLFESWHATQGQPSCDPGLARQVARSLCFKGVVGGNAYCNQMAKGQLVLSGLERDYTVEFCSNIPQP